MSDDIKIENLDVYEFEIPSQEFIIQYNKTNDEWNAIHYDEDKFDYTISFDKDSFNEGSIELFDEYYLNISLFNQLVDVIEKDK